MYKSFGKDVRFLIAYLDVLKYKKQITEELENYNKKYEKFYNKENNYFFEIDANKENKTKGKLITVSNKFFVVCDSSNTYKIWKNQ